MSIQRIPFTLASFDSRRGANEAPPVINTGIVRMQLEPELLKFLESAPEFVTGDDSSKQLSDEEHQKRGFAGPLNDGFHMPLSHIYHEGYFHCSNAGASAEPLQSMNPRFGTPMPKPAAPLQLRAFLRAFKKVNAAWLQPLLEKLELPQMHNEESVFADIAAQSHYGDATATPNEKNVGGWHFDAPNSLLHLAITLHGERRLHYNTHDVNSETKKVTDVHGVATMTPGNVYLTSPSSFMHAVEYPACDWKTRILALQCRTLLPNREGLMRNGTVDWDAKSKLFGEAFLNAPIRLPTFAEVMTCVEELSSSSSPAAKQVKNDEAQ